MTWSLMGVWEKRPERDQRDPWAHQTFSSSLSHTTSASSHLFPEQEEEEQADRREKRQRRDRKSDTDRGGKERPLEVQGRAGGNKEQRRVRDIHTECLCLCEMHTHRQTDRQTDSTSHVGAKCVFSSVEEVRVTVWSVCSTFS